MKIKVKVKPNSGRQEIIRRGKEYFIYLKSRPENNKANIELVKLLKKYFGRPVKIKSGLSSREKVIKVE
jgi:uncharacterized protein (TIGR00251 family)